MFKKGIVALGIALALAAPLTASATGKLGIGMEATVSGFFKPVLKRVKISSVKPGSPAATAGVKPGDYIVEANGQLIDGAPAREMSSRLKNLTTGQHLILKLKRGTDFVIADVVAGA